MSPVICVIMVISGRGTNSCVCCGFRLGCRWRGKRSAGCCSGRVVTGTNVNVTFTHYCGDTISDAFNTSQWPEPGDT